MSHTEMFIIKNLDEPLPQLEINSANDLTQTVTSIIVICHGKTYWLLYAPFRAVVICSDRVYYLCRFHVNFFFIANIFQAFGTPTFIVEGKDNEEHLVFGSDRMHIIAMYLGKKLFMVLLKLCMVLPRPEMCVQ